MTIPLAIILNAVLVFGLPVMVLGWLVKSFGE